MRKSIQAHGKIRIELLFQLFDVAPNLREIKRKHLIVIPERSGMLPYVQATEEPLEIPRSSLVVIEPHHIEEQTLAEPARADEYQSAGLSFKFLNIH